jgi:hypothetical protein
MRSDSGFTDVYMTFISYRILVTRPCTRSIPGLSVPQQSQWRTLLGSPIDGGNRFPQSVQKTNEPMAAMMNDRAFCKACTNRVAMPKRQKMEILAGSQAALTYLPYRSRDLFRDADRAPINVQLVLSRSNFECAMQPFASVRELDRQALRCHFPTATFLSLLRRVAPAFASRLPVSSKLGAPSSYQWLHSLNAAFTRFLTFWRIGTVRLHSRPAVASACSDQSTMAHPPPHRHGQLANGEVEPSQPPRSKNLPARLDRPFTLPEALPFTPFTSITAFDPSR